MQDLALTGGALFVCGAIGLWLARRGAFAKFIESYLAASMCALLLTCMLMGGVGLMAVQLL
jgi:hypothetical protein